ncbi:MAG: recombinase family protein [Clostridia bacterium]|nr:recombinase family protein [Clostridia bacterium]
MKKSRPRRNPSCNCAGSVIQYQHNHTKSKATTLTQHLTIAGYCRISVDEELDRDNVSIENQKSIIADFVKQKFPDSTLIFYEDRDRSGYTFEQRENYQSMRRKLVSREIDILIVKDFSRFARRNSRGLVELEDLRDAGVRIISIGDSIDFPNDDDWLKIQFQFLINEMPVTDTSKKVRSVVRRRQEDGKWICAAPYGYIVNRHQEFEIVPSEAEIVRQIFRLYIDGWGYKKIANHLTDEGIPTPRMAERERKEAAGDEYHRDVKSTWSIVTVQSILDNDFYIGTFRQGKYTRKKINGADLKQSADAHYVFENHHQPIIDYRTFTVVRSLREQRTTSNYRGVKKNDNVYSGFLECGDCGSPMFAMSRSDLADAYRCGLYHRRGVKACTSHHIRVDKLDELLKEYIRLVKENSAGMLDRLNADLAKEDADIHETEQSAAHLAEVLADLQDELKATKRQRIRDIMKHPEREDVLEETYDELEADLVKRIEGLTKQIELTEDKRNMIIRVNRAAKTAMEVFDDILAKEKLDRNDLQFIIEKIRVYEDRIDVMLRSDIDVLLKHGRLPEESDCTVTVVQESEKHPDKVFEASAVNRDNDISEGDPLEIYTDREGEVIFKKYSPIGELANFAAQYAETLHKTCSLAVVICDRDAVIACAGLPKREYSDRKLTPETEDIMEARQLYLSNGEDIAIIEGGMAVSCLMPIITEGDITGCVASVKTGETTVPRELEAKLIQTAAGFLGKQLES